MDLALQCGVLGLILMLISFISFYFFGLILSSGLILLGPQSLFHEGITVCGPCHNRHALLISIF